MRNGTLQSLVISFTFVGLSACASHDLEPVLPRDGGILDSSAKDAAADSSISIPDGRDVQPVLDTGSIDGGKDVPQVQLDGAVTEAGQEIGRASCRERVSVIV